MRGMRFYKLVKRPKRICRPRPVRGFSLPVVALAKAGCTIALATADISIALATADNSLAPG